MLRNVEERAVVYAVWKAAARFPGVSGIGAFGGGEGDWFEVVVDIL